MIPEMTAARKTVQQLIKNLITSKILNNIIININLMFDIKAILE